MTTHIHLDTASSTQDEVHRLAAAGAPHGTAVRADHQAGGRGSRGRSWVSPSGGLWLSVLWRPHPGQVAEIAAAGVQLLGLRAGLAAASVVESLCPAASVRLKWPNDILVSDRKVGGILCEAKWQGEIGWVAIGVGLNVHNAVPEGLRFPAGRLGTWCPALDVASLAASLAAALGQLDAHPALDERELADWARRDWLRGRPVREPVPGVAAGITRSGHLVVTAEAGGHAHEIVAGDGFAL